MLPLALDLALHMLFSQAQQQELLVVACGSRSDAETDMYPMVKQCLVSELRLEHSRNA